jgi:hypothetical protein
MRITDLPSPGRVARGIRMRTDLVQAISSIQIASKSSAGAKVAAAKDLTTCLNAAVSALSGYIDAVVPTVATRSTVAGNAKQVKVTFSEGLRPDVVPSASAFTFSPAKTITGLQIDGKVLTITVSADVTTGATLAYAQPAVNRLQDPSGNVVATWTAATVTIA